MRKTILILAVLAAMPAFGQAYRWVDANGRVQYSDRPPVGKTQAVPVTGVSRSAPEQRPSGDANASKSPTTTTNTTPTTTAEKEQAFRKRLMEKEENEKKQSTADAEKRQKAELCDRAKRHLVSLESGVRHARVELNGERVFLDDAQVANEKEGARRDVEAACNA